MVVFALLLEHRMILIVYKAIQTSLLISLSRSQSFVTSLDLIFIVYWKNRSCCQWLPNTLTERAIQMRLLASLGSLTVIPTGLMSVMRMLQLNHSCFVAKLGCRWISWGSKPFLLSWSKHSTIEVIYLHRVRCSCVYTRMKREYFQRYEIQCLSAVIWPTIRFSA